MPTKIRYNQKIFISSDKTECRKSFKKVVLIRRSFCSEALSYLLKNLYQEFEDSDIYLKDGTASTVKLITIKGQHFVIKRYNIKNFKHGLKRAFMKTRAEYSWINSYRLLHAKIKTSHPIAIVENRIGPFRRTSYFVSEYITGLNLIDNFKKGYDIEETAEKICYMFEKLKKAKLIHGDMKGTNIIIHEKEPYLIDLDGMKKFDHLFKPFFKSQHEKDINRFLKNWGKYPDILKLFNAIKQP